MLLWMSVCMCVADREVFGLYWPYLWSCLGHCFSSLGQETAGESQAEVKVCTFQGNSVLPANINHVV